MDVNNRKNVANIVIFSLFVILMSVLALYNTLGGFGARDTDADDSEGLYVYSYNQFDFYPSGSVLGIALYEGQSKSLPYEVSGFKALTKIDFSVSNVPLGGVVEFCVVKEAQGTHVATPLICDRQNLEVSSNSVWSMELPFGLLVEPGSDYYCRIGVDATRQEVLSVERYESISGNCELAFDALSSKDQVAISLNANPFSTWDVASPQLVPDFDFTVNKDLELIGIYAAIGADNSLPEQKFADICLNAPGGDTCLPSFNFRSGVDGKYPHGIQTLSRQLRAGQKFNFSCRAQQGRYGSCDVYAYFLLDDSTLAGLSTTAVSRRGFFELPTAVVDDYCQGSSYLYQTQSSFVTISPEERQIERCKAILSSADF